MERHRKKFKMINVISSTTNNEKYSSFVDIFLSAWKKIGFNNVLISVNTDNTERIVLNQTHVGYIPISTTKFDIGNNDAFLSQVSRLLVPACHLEFGINKDEIFLTTDMDMIPVSKEYFYNITKQTKENSKIFTIASSDAYKELRYPICYLVGSAKSFQEIINPSNKTFKDLVEEWYKVMHGNWNSDELIFASKFEEWKGDKLFLNRGWDTSELGRTAKKRFDRVLIPYYDNLSNLGTYLRDGSIVDAHLERPFQAENNKELVEFVYGI